MSTAQIEQTLVDQYGQNIMLEPPDSGGFAVIWIVPIVLAAGALAVVGTLFWRRSRLFAATSAAQAQGGHGRRHGHGRRRGRHGRGREAMTTGAVERGTESSGSGSERWYLNDEREFLLRSIDDAERERGAGDLSDADYEVLVARDRTRLAEVEAELAALGPDLGPEPPADADSGGTRGGAPAPLRPVESRRHRRRLPVHPGRCGDPGRPRGEPGRSRGRRRRAP